ncbi:MAG: glycosyltransferase family 1 protein [Proteobacteria bacterium]|nr:MAG: glycosyltransferase family 1 protein [Pseudomonadota bacterium]
MTLNIGIIASLLTRPETGVEVYIKALLNGLSVDRSLRPVGISPRRVEFFKSNGIAEKIIQGRSSLLGRYWWEFFKISDLSRSDIDILHGPNFSVPVVKRREIRYVTTIHDLTFKTHPQYYPSTAKAYYNFATWNSSRICDAIICNSNSTRRDFLRFYPDFPRENLHVIPLGYTDFSQIDSDDTIFKGHGLTQKEFALIVGASHPRKNLERSIEAFLEAGISADTRLVLTGTPSERIFNSYRSNPRVIFTGQVTRNQLASFYKNAQCLIFASHAEGFGLPALEALSVHLPVIASKVGSLPEVTGLPHEMLVDPLVISDIRTKIEYMFESKTFYDDALNIGRENLKSFSWSQCIGDTSRLYHQLIPSGSVQ